jgi:hypothetical protein
VPAATVEEIVTAEVAPAGSKTESVVPAEFSNDAWMSRFGRGRRGVAVRESWPAPLTTRNRSTSARVPMIPVAGAVASNGVAVPGVSPWSSARSGV